MKSYKLIIMYDGTDFYGSQVNGDLRTLEKELTSVISRINDEPSKIYLASRLDKGVHARGMTAKVSLKKDVKDLKYVLNNALARDIYIKEASVIDNTFNPRYDALYKIYTYYINTKEDSPFINRYSLYINKNLDINKMKDAKTYLEGTHDFTYFTDLDNDKNPIRKIDDIKIEEDDKIIKISFKGKSFLRYQVRYMTGILIKVGLGEINPIDVKRYMSGELKLNRNFKADSKGLFLERIIY